MTKSFSEIGDFIHLWIYTKKNKKLIISNNELNWSKNLNIFRSEEYKQARGFLRQSLSNLFNLNPLDIPLHAMPNKAPSLVETLGFVSISHCNDAYLIGWSKNKIGIDIENKNRQIKNDKIFEKIFTKNEKKIFLSDAIKSSENLIRYWTLKESAIKWQRSSIYKELKNWEIESNKKKIFNLKNNIRLDIETINYKNWIVSTATQKLNNNSRSNYLCTDNN